jgi:flagellar M-ring protein FliF
VDYRPGEIGEDGISVPAPRAQSELENIRRLLQGGVGFDAQRGDIIEVISVPFMREQLEVETAAPFYEQEWFLQVVKLVMGGLVIIVLLWGIVRPMLQKLMNPA